MPRPAQNLPTVAATPLPTRTMPPARVSGATIASAEQLGGRDDLETTHFVESQCVVGGVFCGAWHDWFQACDDTDPKALAEERDPSPLVEWPFDPLGCERPDVCPLYAKARGVAA